MHIGVIDLQLERHAGRWTSRPAAVSLRSITPGTPALPEVVEEVRAEHGATVAFSRRSVGRSLVPLDTFFATATASAAMRVVAEAQARHVARQVAGRTEAALPIVSAVSPLKAGGVAGRRTIPRSRRATLRCAMSRIFTSFPIPSRRCA
ncbi:hypothetical protein ACFSHQ_22505 [Gemmobacter lanyuensis]